MRPRQIALGAFLTSCVVHSVAVLSLELLPPPPKDDLEAPLVNFDATPLPETKGALGQAPRTPQVTAPPLLGGPKSRSFLDRTGEQARGGDGAALEDGLLMFAFESSVTLTDTELNNFDRNQTHRLRTADERASLEQRRATPRPTDATFLATGAGDHAERRKASALDSAQGALVGQLSPKSEPHPSPTRTRATSPWGAQAAPVSAPSASSDVAQRTSTVEPAAPQEKSMRGIARGRGRRASAEARVATARPNVDRGPAATTAQLTDERVRDDADAELLAAKLERSFVEASMQRAARIAQGVGGDEGAHAGFGSAAAGDGAQALPYAPGAGTEGALDTSDARYVRWFTDLRSRVQKALVFPEERALAMDQGTTIYRVIVARDGRMKAAPKLVRSSGFADLDRAAISAILEAAPFAPLPLELLPEQGEVAILMPIQFWNPMVR